MQIDKEALWTLMKKKAQEEDAIPENTQKVEHAYIAGVQSICEYAVGRASRIQNNFPMFTLHDETHICNVMRIMMQLLGNLAETLSRDEAAMLILAACCHDIGMSYSPEADGDLLEDTDRLNRYFDEHRGEYVKAYSGGRDHPNMTDSMIQRFLRCIHHERCADLLYTIEWPAVLNGKVERGDLVRVCQSHGEDAELLKNLAPTTTVDLRLCAILLRLADILDFDTSRAPSAVYDYCGFDKLEASEALISREQWQIHRSSHGFDFIHIHDRSIPYELPYHATSKSMQIEQTVSTYLDWVDQELILCGKQLSSLSPRWQKLILPVKIQRQITPDGYLTGQYRLTLDQEQVLDLLVGRDLYSDPAVFVRELIQNAIDAVRTRKELDKNLPNNWKPQINIRTWMDAEGYHWFRIEDNGTGMSEEIIRNHLLKIGSSYYKSDLFEQEKLRCKADPNYQPISRFGIGILSCFMSDKEHNRVEISTKRFRDGSDYPPALRLSMQGMNGYYYMASKEKNHHPGPMIGRTPAEQKEYLSDAGTVVAVRTDLNSSGKYRGFKEIVDRYVVFPPVDIHYEGEEDSLDYTTEETFIKKIKEIQRSEDPAKSGLFEQSLSDEQLEDICREYPGVDLSKPPKALLKCAALDRYTASPNLTGALLTATVMNQIPRFSHQFGALKLDISASVTGGDNE